MKALTLLALTLLAGCASYSEIRDSEPTVDVVTAKESGVYAGCLAPKLMEIWPGQVSVIPDGGNTVIAVGNGASMTATVTIEQGGRVTLREMTHIDLGSAFKRARQYTSDCI